MLRIRLTRVGKKNSPSYRVVVADQRKAVKRSYIEILGHYNPSSNPKELVINKERALHWISKGAQASDTVNNLMVNLEILPKKALIKKIYGKPTKKKDAGKEAKAENQPASEEINAEESTETAEPVEEAPTEETATVESPDEDVTPTEETVTETEVAEPEETPVIEEEIAEVAKAPVEEK